MDNLLSAEEVNDLVTGLNITEDSYLMKKGATKDEGGAQINRRNNLDQLGPKALRAKGDTENVSLTNSPSFSPKFPPVPETSLRPSGVELNMNEVDDSRPKNDDPKLEFVEETPKDLQGATFKR